MTKFSKAVQVKIFHILAGEWLRLSNQDDSDKAMSVISCEVLRILRFDKSHIVELGLELMCSVEYYNL